ncbi:MAG: Methyltransferase type 11 [Bacteroidetes bacterium]|nr:Methyltransferase type 11 [Bacteroidota bacterium]
MSIRWKIAQWFELRWWQRYFEGKNKAQYYGWKRKYWNDLLDKLADVLPLDSAKLIADLGCGPAGIFIVFGPQTPKGGFNTNEGETKVVAADPLLNEYAATLGFFDQKDFPYTTFVNQSLEDFSPAEKFDIVFCMNAINHVADINRAYDKLVGAAKDGGSVVVSIDAHNHSFFKHLFRLVPGDILHPHQYDLEEYNGFLTSRGCTVTKTVLIKKEFFFSHYVVVAKLS